jgi:hypothetical protein
MGIFEKLGLAGKADATIDWEITPALTFTIFESWGTKERNVRNKSDRYYYFYIDNWEKPAQLCLMERGIKHAKVMAEIDAPQDMIDRAVAEQGETSGLDRCYAVNGELKQWLNENVLKGECKAVVRPVVMDDDHEDLETDLPLSTDSAPELVKRSLPCESREVAEGDVQEIVTSNGFFDSKWNPQGGFLHHLVDNNDGLTVTEMVTGVMWQRQGSDLNSIRHTHKYAAELNNNNFAGFNDWRLPTIEEAMSVLVARLNTKGLFLHECFSKKQPFIFTSAQRTPGGYWFVDYKQGTVYWASGTNPGGFGRLCRTV